MEKNNSNRPEKVEVKRSNVQIANEVSIMDYINQNAIDVLYEDKRTAKVEDINGSLITIYKLNNSWSLNEDGKKETYGNTIRFVTKMRDINWKDAMEYLVENRDDYMSYEEYNTAYSQESNPSKVMDGNGTPKNAKGTHMNRVREVSISDYAQALGREWGLPVETLANGKVTRIKDGKYEGLLIYNRSNLWDWKSKFIQEGNAVQFVQMIQQVDKEMAIEYLNRFAETGKIFDETREVIVKEELEEFDIDEKNNFMKEETIMKEEKVVHTHSGVEQRHMTKEQLSELLVAYRRNIDVSSFNNIDLTPEQMKQLRLATLHGVDANEFNDSILSPEFMKEMRVSKKLGMSLDIFKNEQGEFVFHADQAKQIRLGYENGLSRELIDDYAKIDLSADVMKELRLGFQNGLLEMKDLNSGVYKAEDIHAIRITLVVKNIIESIKLHIRNLYDSLISLFHETLPNGAEPKVEIENSTNSSQNLTLEEKGLAKIIEKLYVELDENYIELSFDEKTDLIVDSLRKIIHASREVESENILDEVNKAVDALTESREVENLKTAAFESLQEDYLDAFYANENAYNQSIIDFAGSVLSDSSIQGKDKAIILDKTLGTTFGEEITQKLVDQIPLERESFNDEQMQLHQREYSNYSFYNSEQLARDKAKEIHNNSTDKTFVLSLSAVEEHLNSMKEVPIEHEIEGQWVDIRHVLTDLKETIEHRDSSLINNEINGSRFLFQNGSSLSIEEYKQMKGTLLEVYNNTDISHDNKVKLINAYAGDKYGKEFTNVLTAAIPQDEKFQEMTTIEETYELEQ